MDNKVKKIAVLGSTGSIGTQTLEIVRDNSKSLCVVSLAAASNVQKMEEQILEFRKKKVAMYSQDAANELT